MLSSSPALRRGAAPLLAVGLSALALGACGSDTTEPAAATDNEREERPYGVDSGFHDPSGNSFRLTQVKERSPA